MRSVAILWFVSAVGLSVAAAEEAKGFRTLDLRPVVNMAWRDEVAGDGKGGWSDQGRNDMREVEPGRKTLRGIPFDLIDPKLNAGKSVLVLKSRNFANGVASCRVAVGAKAASVYFLHAAAWNRGHMATYVVHYADGTSVEIPVRANHEIANWWRPKDGGSYRAALHVPNAECDDVGLVAFGWANPSPDKLVKEIEFRSQNEAGVPIVAAVTLWQKTVAFADAKAPEPPADAAAQVLAAFRSPRADRVLKEVGQRLAADRDEAARVLDALAKDGSLDAATAEAELFTWIARGDETPGWKKPSVKPKEMSTDELGRRAAALLGHDDPFVRDIAEWALAIRLGSDYEGTEERLGSRRVAREWPGEDAPDWYRRWAAIGADAALELDYVRQAAALGAHRSTASLVRSSESLVTRADGLLGYIRQCGTPAQISSAETRFAELRDAQHRLADAAKARPAELSEHRKLWLAVRHAARGVALANADISFAQILFGLRQAASQNGNITAGRWNTHTPGGDIVIKTGFAPTDPVKPLLNGRLGPGHVRGLDLRWDADRIVFAYARQPGKVRTAPPPPQAPKGDLGGYFGMGTEVEELSRLFEMNADGTGLRQRTASRYNADQEPCYLPNGDIAFVSDRSNFGSQCAGALEPDNMILNLNRCGPDGANIHPLSNNKDFDRHPHVMDTGQLLFLHWEYQERHLWQTHTLWTCRPDGTMADAIFKQHIETGPMSLREARQVPGQRKLVAIACGHHNFDQGAVFLADYAKGINERDAMRNVTPGASGTEGGYGGVRTVAEGGVQDGGGHYMFPYPLSDKSFLVAYSYKRPEDEGGRDYSLYYVDVWGNKELIHRDKHLSVAYLMPLRKTPRPPVIEELPTQEPGERFAVAAVMNVHEGWPSENTGRIKWLRISQKVPWPCVRDESKACGFNDLHWMPAAWEPVLGMWDWGTARVIGMVPVEADGSAHFKVPADQTVYFQALDENFLELRRMRSNVTFRAGETRSCVGCHESRPTTPPASQGPAPLALRRSPSTPEPPAWGDRIVPDFERHIQPIFDRHCVRCHGEKDPKGGLDFTSRKVDGYVQSYRTIFGLKPTDRTPFSRGYWTIWHPGEPPLSNEAIAYAKTFLRSILRDPPAAQLVTVADYTGGSGVTQPLEFGSGKSKLTLVLVRNKLHRDECKLSRSEWLSLVTWVDLNAQYWGTFIEKDSHFASRRTKGDIVPPRRVRVEFPDPWRRPPAGEWIWKGNDLVELKP